PAEHRLGRKLDELIVVLERLVGRHADNIWSEYAVKLKIWRDPDGLYLLKAVAPKCGSGFASKTNGAKHKASFMASDAAPIRASAHQLVFAYYRPIFRLL